MVASVKTQFRIGVIQAEYTTIIQQVATATVCIYCCNIIVCMCVLTELYCVVCSCYSAAYMSRLMNSSAFTVLEMAADWHELVIPHTSTACDSRQLDLWCSMTDIPLLQISHTMPSLQPIIPYSLTDAVWMACWAGVGTQQPQVRFEPAESSTLPHSHKHWVGLSSVLRPRQYVKHCSLTHSPRQHSIGYTADSFYTSKDPTNSVKVLKEMLQRTNQTTKTTKYTYAQTIIETKKGYRQNKHNKSPSLQ